MSKLNFLSENLLTEYDTSLSMVSGTVNQSFPLDNIRRKFTTKVFRSNENTIEILVDLLQVREVDTFMIVGNALTGLGFTSMTIQGSATTLFTGVTPINIDLNNDFSVGYSQFTPVSVRYWKINVTNTGSFCELSNFFIGKANVLENNAISISSFRYSVEDRSRVSTNDYGQEFTDKRNKQKQIRGSIQYCNSAETLQLDNIFLRHTDSTPLWVIIDKDNNITSDGQFRFSGYFSLTNEPSWSATGYGLFNTSVRFRQVI